MRFDLDLYSEKMTWRSIPAALFGAAGGIRRILYRTGVLKIRKLPVRVISVGGLAVGGTGKTPTAIMIARRLQTANHRAAILSRGYKGRSSKPVNVVSDGERVLLGPKEAGDEACLMAQFLPGIPVLTGSNRYITGRYAIDKLGAEVLVLDDGFQHLRLARDLNLLLLDAAGPWGNGRLLPAGPLREPPRAANRADAFLLTGADAVDQELKTGLAMAFPGRPVFFARRRPYRLRNLTSGENYSLDILKNQRVTAFCGLARPQGFIDSIISLGARVEHVVRWPDHFYPRAQDVEEITIQAQRLGIGLAVTTAKDAVKLGGRSFRSLQILVLEIEMELCEDQDGFQALIDGLGDSFPG